MFDVFGYLIQFTLMFHNNSLLTDFCLKDGLDNDRLDWPFRAKFTVRLITTQPMIRPRESDKFRSEVIGVSREDLASNFRIATIPFHYPFTLYIVRAELKISIFFY